MGFTVSVVIAAYNAERTIRRALQSVRAQTFPPREVVVVDDGSSDRTAEIAAGEGAVVLRRANGGQAAARNDGIRAARYDWISFLDADDLWFPHRLAEHKRTVEACPAATVIFSGAYRRRPDDRRESRALRECPSFVPIKRRVIGEGIWELDRESLVEHFLDRPFVEFGSISVRRDRLLDAGLFDESLRSSEDFELWLRLFGTETVCAIDAPLLDYFVGFKSVSSDGDLMMDSVISTWDRVAAAPERYAPNTAACLRRYVGFVLRESIRIYLLQGNLPRARSTAGLLLQFEPGARSRAFAACVRLAATAPARAGHRLLHTAWRRMRRKPAA